MAVWSEGEYQIEVEMEQTWNGRQNFLLRQSSCDDTAGGHSSPGVALYQRAVVWGIQGILERHMVNLPSQNLVMLYFHSYVIYWAGTDKEVCLQKVFL